jgi:hypothetical protein
MTGKIELKAKYDYNKIIVVEGFTYSPFDRLKLVGCDWENVKRN